MPKILAALALSALCISGHASIVYRDRIFVVPDKPPCMVELDPGVSVDAHRVTGVAQDGIAWVLVPNPKPKKWYSLFYVGQVRQYVKSVIVYSIPDREFSWPGTDAERAERYGRYMAAIEKCRESVQPSQPAKPVK